MNRVWVFCPGGTINRLFCVTTQPKPLVRHKELKLCGPISEQLVPTLDKRDVIEMGLLCCIAVSYGVYFIDQFYKNV